MAQRWYRRNMAEDDVRGLEVGTRRQRVRILACGFVMVALAIGAVLLPIVEHVPAAAVVGWLLLLAGLTELVASGAGRLHGYRKVWIAAGGITSLAGLVFILNPLLKLVPVSYIAMAWLFLRGLLLLAAAARVHAGGKNWIAFSGTADMILAIVLLTGLPLAALVTGMFGPTIELVASFGLVLATSFLVTGIGFFGIANAGRGQDW